jgi:primosomal protein N'
VEIKGPAATPLAKMKGYYRYHFVLSKPIGSTLLISNPDYQATVSN